MRIRKIHTKKHRLRLGHFRRAVLRGKVYICRGRGGFRPEDGKVVSGGVNYQPFGVYLCGCQRAAPGHPA